jgi:hypothetical protein
MTSGIVLTDSHSFYLLRALYCGLCGSVGSWPCWLLTLLQLLQETHLGTEILRIWQWRRGVGFILPPCALHCGLWGSIGPCWWTKGSNNNTDELNPFAVGTRDSFVNRNFENLTTERAGRDSSSCLGWISTHTGMVVPWWTPWNPFQLLLNTTKILC